jgi:hypothetical protein
MHAIAVGNCRAVLYTRDSRFGVNHMQCMGGTTDESPVGKIFPIRSETSYLFLSGAPERTTGIAVEFLLLRSVITPSRSDLYIFLQGGNLDRAVAPVGVEIRRMVGDDVLAAQFVFDRRE